MPDDKIVPADVEEELDRLQKEKRSRLINIGQLEKGAGYHRSLLFKGRNSRSPFSVGFVFRVV